MIKKYQDLIFNYLILEFKIYNLNEDMWIAEQLKEIV